MPDEPEESFQEVGESAEQNEEVRVEHYKADINALVDEVLARLDKDKPDEDQDLEVADFEVKSEQEDSQHESEVLVEQRSHSEGSLDF